MADVNPEWKIYAQNHQYRRSDIGTESDKIWKNDFFFVQGSDPQFGMMNSFQNENFNPKIVNWDEEMRLAELSVEKVNQMNPKPRFFIICGDLTHQMPNADPVLFDLKRRQINDFKRIFSRVDPLIPLICVCGNHDIGDFPTPDSIQKYRSTFGDDFFSFWCDGVFFIVLNSQYYKERDNVLELADEQDRWLDEQLKTAQGFPIVCFSHVPWFVTDINEEVGVFNVAVEWRIKMLNKLYDAGVRYIFCGHYHKNGGVFFKDLEIVITSAIGMQLGIDKSGFRIVNVSKHKITHKYYEFDKVPVNFPSCS